jgi:PEP-CTERM motif
MIRSQGEVTIPGYASGPISFEVYAFNGTVPFGPNSLPAGISAPFTLPGIATGISPVSDLFNGGVGGPYLEPFSVGFVPEPATMTLFSLGAAAFVLRRRK